MPVGVRLIVPCPRAVYLLAKEWLHPRPGTKPAQTQSPSPDVPTIYELMTRYQTPEPKQRIVSVLLGADYFGQYLAVAPPGVPQDRLQILRDAYSRALKDPDLLEEAKRRNWSVEHIAGDELQKLSEGSHRSTAAANRQSQRAFGRQLD